MKERVEKLSTTGIKSQLERQIKDARQSHTMSGDITLDGLLPEAL